MKGVYEENPTLGDPMSIEGQLNESNNRLEKLKSEIQKYQVLLEDVERNSPAGIRKNSSNGIQHKWAINWMNDKTFSLVYVPWKSLMKIVYQKEKNN